MPQYSYVVRNEMGKVVHGKMESRGMEDLAAALQRQGFWIISIKEEKKKKEVTRAERRKRMHTRVRAEDLMLFAQQMATLTEASVPFLKSLEILKAQTSSRMLYDIIDKIEDDAKAGLPLFRSLSKHPRIFTPLWLSLVEAGESSGRLAEVLDQLARYIEERQELKKKVINALIYPVMLLGMTVGVVVVLLVKIIPTFAELFAGFNMELPMLTRIVIKVSYILKDYFLFVVVGVAAVVYLIKRYIQTPQGKELFDKVSLKVPIMGALIKNISLERFANDLFILLRSAVPILSSLEIITRVVGNTVMQDTLEQARRDVQEGKSMSESLSKSGIFPPLVTEMIIVGEETGRLPQMLERVGKHYKSMVEATISRLTAAFEPMIIILMGVVVGTIVLAAFMPIFQMSQIGR